MLKTTAAALVALLALPLFAIDTDQTLLGPVSETSLTRTIAFSIQHRWER